LIRELENWKISQRGQKTEDDQDFGMRISDCGFEIDEVSVFRFQDRGRFQWSGFRFSVCFSWHPKPDTWHL